MAEDRYIYSPQESRVSYADELRQQAELIRKIQGQNIAARVSQYNTQQKAKKEQLSLIQKFKTDGWSPQAVGAFGQLTNEVSRRIDGGYYQNTNQFRNDLTKLMTMHTGIDNHFSTLEDPYKNLVKYAEDPSSYPDDSVKVIDDADSVLSKKMYQDTLGLQDIQVDTENLDILGNYLDLAGNPIGGDQGFGSVLNQPFLANPQIFSPSIQALGDFEPSDFAEELLVSKAQDLIQAGEAPDVIKAKIEAAIDRYLDPSSDIHNKRAYNTAQNLYGDLGMGEVEGVSALNRYKQEVMKYVPLQARERRSSTRKVEKLILDRIENPVSEYSFGDDAPLYTGNITTYVMTDLEKGRGIQIPNPAYDPNFDPNSAEGMLADASTIKLKQTRFLVPDFREIKVVRDLNRIIIPTEFQDITIDLNRMNEDDKRLIAQVEQALNEAYDGVITIYDLLRPEETLKALESEPSAREYKGIDATPQPTGTPDPLDPDNY